MNEQEKVLLIAGFSVQERNDGTIALFDENDVLVAQGNTPEEVFKAFETNLELRLIYSTMAFLGAVVPNEGILA